LGEVPFFPISAGRITQGGAPRKAGSAARLTAGFLIAASEHLVAHHSETIYKTEASRKKFNSGTFHGYDFDNTMRRYRLARNDNPRPPASPVLRSASLTDPRREGASRHWLILVTGAVQTDKYE